MNAVSNPRRPTQITESRFQVQHESNGFTTFDDHSVWSSVELEQMKLPAGFFEAGWPPLMGKSGVIYPLTVTAVGGDG